MEDAERMAREEAECARSNNASAPPAGTYCAGTYDTWLCWPHTSANTTAYLRCPHFVPGFSTEREYLQGKGGGGEQEGSSSHRRPSFCRSVRAQAVRRGGRLVPAPGHGPALVQLHDVRGGRGRRVRHHRALRGGLRRLAGRAARLHRHPAVLPVAALRAHHGAHQPVRLVRAQQRGLARVVRAGGARARRAQCGRAVVPRAARGRAVRHADHVHVDAVRGAVPAHGAGTRLRVGAAAAARAAGAGLAAAAGERGGVRGAACGGGWRGVLDGRGGAARRVGRAGGGGRAAQSRFPVQHSARAVQQAAARRGRRRRGRAGAALGHGAARAARHVPAGAAAGAAVPADAVPSDARGGPLVARLRVRHGADHVAAGAVRRRALLLLQRRGAGAAPSPLARADLPPARQLRHRHHRLLRAVGRGRRVHGGQGVTSGGRGRGRRGRGWRGRGWRGRVRAAAHGGGAAHPLRARAQRRGSAAARAPAPRRARAPCLAPRACRLPPAACHLARTG